MFKTFLSTISVGSLRDSYLNLPQILSCNDSHTVFKTEFAWDFSKCFRTMTAKPFSSSTFFYRERNLLLVALKRKLFLSQPVQMKTILISSSKSFSSFLRFSCVENLNSGIVHDRCDLTSNGHKGKCLM